MDLQTSVSTVFSKYADFTGRASRSEFWWFILFALIANLVLNVIDGVLLGMSGLQPLSTLFSLAIILPSLAVGARRLHDIGKSGWWQLLFLVPLIGGLIILYLVVQRSVGHPNDHGEVPPEARRHTAPAST